jgi:hypothetical protein
MTADGCSLLLPYGCLAHFHKPWGMKRRPFGALSGRFHFAQFTSFGESVKCRPPMNAGVLRG